MRIVLCSVCVAVVTLAGCGFEDVAPPTTQTPDSSGSGSTTGSGGALTNTAGVASGGSAAAGQPAGTAGSMTMPQGGSAGQAGSNTGGVSTAGAGGSGTAGSNTAGSGGMGSGGGSAVDPRFKLKWRDDFDSFNDARWAKRTHTFAENLARFSAGNVVVEGGFLKLRVTKVQNGDKQYSAAEVASVDEFTFGRFAGRIKFCAGSGMVSSLFTYKENVNQSWQEIDIEHLGNLPKSIQYNLIWGTNANRMYQPKVVNLAFGPPTEFHDYVIEWLPDGITFFIDGKQTHKDVQATIKDAATLHMNAWPTNNAVTMFAGPFDSAAVPCEAQYDWVEAYNYAP
jgi:beta-glucanase (GH16 family)